MGGNYSFIQERSDIGKHAGSKARQDIDVVFEQMIRNVAFSYSEHRFSSFFEKICYVLSPHNISKFIELSQVKDKRLFIQYPFIRILFCVSSFFVFFDIMKYVYWSTMWIRCVSLVRMISGMRLKFSIPAKYLLCIISEWRMH